MKAIIISDIHGDYKSLEKIISDNPEFDYLIIAGDLLYGGTNALEVAEILNKYRQKIFMVEGNCDFGKDKYFDFPIDNPYMVFPIDNKLFFITHGHLYQRYSMPDVEYDVYIQGHTHVASMEKDNDKIYLNPGSLAYPRGLLGKTYIMYANGIFSLKSVDDNKVIKEIKY